MANVFEQFQSGPVVPVEAPPGVVVPPPPPAEAQPDNIFAKFHRADVTKAADESIEDEATKGRVREEINKLAIPLKEVPGKMLEGIPVYGAFADRAKAAADAAGTGIAQATGLSKIDEAAGFDDKLSRAPDFSTRYQENLAKLGQTSRRVEEEHPYGATAAKVAGAVAGTAPLVAGAPAAFGIGDMPWVVRALTGGTTSSGIAAADAAARGENVPAAAAVGALGGAALPIAGKAIGSLGGKVAGAVAEETGPLAGMNQQALGWASRAAKADGLTDAQIAEKSADPQRFLFEYGPNLFGRAQGTAVLPGQGKQELLAAIDKRSAGAPQRIESAITDVMGPRVNVATLTREGIAERKEAAGPLFDAFRTTQVHPTDELKALVPVLEKDGLLAAGRHLMELETAATGRPHPPTMNFFTGGDRKDWPTTESFQYIKQAIDDKIGSSFVEGRPTNATRIYTLLKKKLDSSIENANPEAAAVWKQARDAWGTPSGIMNARQRGQEAWLPSYRRDEMLYDLTEMSAPERTAFKQGARDALAKKFDDNIHGNRQVRDQLLAPTNQEKLDYLATNKDVKSQTLIDKLEAEREFAATPGAIKGGSQTSAREQSAAELKPDPSETFAHRVRHMYLPHVTPEMLIPRSLEKVAAASQASKFEAARDALAPLLHKQGPEAAEMLRALVGWQGPVSGRIDTGATNLLQMLSRGVQPAVPQQQRQ